MRVRKMTALMLAGAMTASMGTFAFADEAKELPTIDSIKLGEDYTDLTASIKVLTHRTDIVDTTFQDYIKKFNESYPNITIEYEAVTDYAEDIKLRLTTDDWGDICGIPTSLQKNELEDEFISYGDKETLDESYVLLNNFAYNGNVYGIPSTGNAQGIVYNKKVFEEAGVTELPKTPTEFIEALQKIKDNTDAIPMYTNFAAGWTMGAWDAYIGGCATGDPDFMNYGMVHGENPFADNGDETGPFAVYNILYQAVSQELIEDDPTTTDWEGCKGMINNGEIGCMVLGSWAVVQMQQAGDNADDIGYMPIPICVGGEYPDVLAAFDGVDLVVDNPAPEGEEDLFGEINTESEISLNADNTHVQDVLEHALNGDKTMEEIADEWNQAWTDAQEEYDVTPVPYVYGSGVAAE